MVPDESILRSMDTTTTTSNSSSTSSTSLAPSSKPGSSSHEDGGVGRLEEVTPHPQREGDDTEPSQDGGQTEELRASDLKLRSHSPPDNTTSANGDSSAAYSNSTVPENCLEPKSVVCNDSSNVVLRIPQSRLESSVESSNISKSVTAGSVPDISAAVTDPAATCLVESDGVSSRRASYIDVVGLSADEATDAVVTANGTASPSHTVSTQAAAAAAAGAPCTNDSDAAELASPGHHPTAPGAASGLDGTSAPLPVPADEDKDLSEDEGKLVIHEGSAEKRVDNDAQDAEDQEIITIGAVKRTAETHVEYEQPNKKVCGAPRPPTPGEGQPDVKSLADAAQGRLLMAKLSRDVQELEQQVRQKETEWNAALRNLKEKQMFLECVRRRTQILRFQTGEADLASPVTIPSSSGAGLLAALTHGSSAAAAAAAAAAASISNRHNNGINNDDDPLTVMAKLLAPSNRSNTSSPNISIIDIHTRTSSPSLSSPSQPDSSSLTTSHSTNRYFMADGGTTTSLTEAVKSRLSRQMMQLSGKPILPKPQIGSAVPGNNGSSTLLSSLARQSPAPPTLAGMLAGTTNGPSTTPQIGERGGPPHATGYGPQGPTISVQQLIAAHRKDNPAAPPLSGTLRGADQSALVNRGAKRGAWRHKYDSGKRGSRGDAGLGSGLALSDPNISYNDVLLQFAQLNQQQQQQHVAADKNSPGSPQVSIIPVSDSTGSSGLPYNGGSSINISGGLSVTPAPPIKHSPALEGSSALAKLLMESRGGNKALLEHQQQAGTQHYLTLSALLAGSAKERGSGASMQSSDGRSKRSEGHSDGSTNPKCQGCHKVRAQFVCAGCGNQWYCSRECQVTAWDEHSERCNT